MSQINHTQLQALLSSKLALYWIAKTACIAIKLLYFTFDLMYVEHETICPSS